jgi:cell division protein FtsN
MARTNDGELELVLGNRQLLSVFFVVVVLLGIFFAMGYIVGRNSSAGPTREVAVSEPLIVEPGRPSEPPVATPKPQLETELKELPPAEPPRQAPETKPAPTAQPPALAKPAPAKPAPAKPAPAAASEPQPGQTFLQVAATTRAEAEALKDQLGRKGFTVVLGPVPGQDLLRVLVGPLQDPATLAKTRTALQEMGLKPFTRRY